MSAREKITAVLKNNQLVAWSRGGVHFHVGDHVRLRKRAIVDARHANTTAIIERVMTDPEGGVYLHSKIDGFFSWNVSDLRKVNRKRYPPPLPFRGGSVAIRGGPKLWWSKQS